MHGALGGGGGAMGVGTVGKHEGEGYKDAYEDVTAHNMLAFGQWYFFCQHCKHGGHAACIESWYDNRN